MAVVWQGCDSSLAWSGVPANKHAAQHELAWVTRLSLSLRGPPSLSAREDKAGADLDTPTPKTFLQTRSRGKIDYAAEHHV